MIYSPDKPDYGFNERNPEYEAYLDELRLDSEREDNTLIFRDSCSVSLQPEYPMSEEMTNDLNECWI